MISTTADIVTHNICFRPLSWGLSFNNTSRRSASAEEFSSPFLGTFFQYAMADMAAAMATVVFVPFLGDFLSIK